jgi:hypothetical protein
MHQLYLCICVIVISVCAFSSATETAERPDIDLYKGTLNKRPFYEFTVDDVTDMFGRPSRTQEKEQIATVSYHDLGMMFMFRPSEKSPAKNQKCIGLYISMSKQEDTLQENPVRISEFFMPYKGSISKNIDDNWKMKRVKDEFKGAVVLNERDAGFTLDLKTHIINFMFEPVNKFLEIIVLGSPDAMN